MSPKTLIFYKVLPESSRGLNLFCPEKPTKRSYIDLFGSWFFFISVGGSRYVSVFSSAFRRKPFSHGISVFSQAVMDPKNGAYRPRCGISDGWVPARVVADQLKNEDVKVPERCGGFTLRPRHHWIYMGGLPKIVFFSPNHPFVHRVFHEINHPFWGFPFFGNTHIPWIYPPGSQSQIKVCRDSLLKLWLSWWWLLLGGG